MFALADKSANKHNCDQIVRDGILRYLECSRAEQIEAILSEDNIFSSLFVFGCLRRLTEQLY
jgi:hypothetical protein